ncbi:inner membrane CreD family protein [Zophobihabitans entericus]|uniref:Inner membrane protein CreD n=1 Tax=Zophobihabitans entericus TaxID=1635327 RepID=A0A6G9IBD4_9GAMM|nr:inner membrane CreD family protein [Zophobihabitans entericus]QIQ21545.1 hypothetical protein IPMB12_07515 [Zophobihabitans entericus]
MEMRLTLFWKVIAIIALTCILEVPLYIVGEYIANKVTELNSVSSLIVDSADKLTSLLHTAVDTTKDGVVDASYNYELNARLFYYSVFFLGLAFLLLLVIDFLAHAKLHLFHYSIIGIGLLLFYLVTLALSDYVAFPFAYSISAVLCALLSMFYLSSPMNSIGASVGYGVVLLVLFGLNFYLVTIINNVLIFSVICLFILFVTVLVLTRTVNWNEPPKRIEGGAEKIS